MKWEITDNRPKVGDIRFKTRFAFLPTRVLSKLTMSDHIIWLELYVIEQVYTKETGWDGSNYYWRTVAKTTHV